MLLLTPCSQEKKHLCVTRLDDQTGELVERELSHEGEEVRNFYAALPQPVLVGMEATGAMQRFLRLLA